MTPSWFRQLDKATSVAEVVAITRDFFALWSPEEIVQLPASCRPARFRDAADVEDLHRRAVEEFRSTRATGSELVLLKKLAGFMGRACMRIAQLNSEAADADEPEAARQPEARQTGKPEAARGP